MSPIVYILVVAISALAAAAAIIGALNLAGVAKILDTDQTVNIIVVVVGGVVALGGAGFGIARFFRGRKSMASVSYKAKVSGRR